MKKLTSLLTLLIVLSFFITSCGDDTTTTITPDVTGSNFLVTGAYWVSEDTEFDENGNIDPEWTTIDSTWIGDKTTFDGKEVFPMLTNSTDENNNPIIDTTYMFFSGNKLFVNIKMDDDEENPFSAVYNNSWMCMADFGISQGNSWTVMDIDTTINVPELGGDADVKMTMVLKRVAGKNINVNGETIATTGFEMTMVTILDAGTITMESTETSINYVSYNKGMIYADDKGGTSVFEYMGQKEEEIDYGGESKLLRYFVPE